VSKDFEGDSYDLFHEILLERLRKTKENHRTAGNLPVIQSAYYPNTNLQCYCYTKLVSNAVP